MVADDISVIYACLCHNLVVLRVDAVVPAHDVAQAYSEGVVSVHTLHELGHIIGLCRQVGQLAPFADLRVGDDDEVVVGVVLGVLCDDEVIFLYFIFDFLVEECFAVQCR